MGFSIPALSAVKLADKNNNVIGICGDGGFQMMVGELAVASQLGLNYVLAVFNNGILGRILAQEHRPSVSHIHNPDFELLAKAYGAEAAVITGDCDLEATLNKAFEHKGSPYILDVRLDPEIFAPMSKWDGGFVPIHFT
jgi:acetolactate synthase-1/2/3 large subunit